MIALNIDLAPTLLDYAGISIPAGMQGRSLRSLVGNALPGDWRTEFFYEHHTGEMIIPPSEAVRTEQWKYIVWTKAEPEVEELYDLATDPLEEKNLIGEASAKETLNHLRARRQKWLEQLR